MRLRESGRLPFFNSIRWQLLIIILTLSVLPLIIIVSFSTIRNYKYLEKQHSDTNQELTRAVSANIDFVYEQYARTLTNIIHIPDVVAGINAPAYTSISEERRVSQLVTGNHISKGGLINSIEEKIDGYLVLIELDRSSLIDKTPWKIHQTAHTYSPPVPIITELINDPLYISIQDDPALKMVIGSFSNNVMSRGDADLPVILYPITRDIKSGEIKKCILVVLHSNVLPAVYKDIEKIQAGTLYIMDRNGNTIVTNHPGKDDYYNWDDKLGEYILEEGDDYIDPFYGLTFSDYQLLNTDQVILQNERIVNLLQNRPDVIFDDESGIRKKQLPVIIKHGGIAYVAVVAWSLQSECSLLFLQPVSQISKPIRTTLNVVIIITFFIIFLVIYISFVVSKSFTAPIKNLSDAALQIINGNYAISVKQGYSNEIGLLADSYNRMIVEIREQSEMLKRQVEEKTSQLEEANAELVKKNRFKSQYLADMSHEIREPINIIQGFTQIMMYNNSDLSDTILELNKKLMVYCKNRVSEVPGLQQLNDFFFDVDQSMESEKELLFLYGKLLQIYIGRLSDNNGVTDRDKHIISSIYNEVDLLHREYQKDIKQNMHAIQDNIKSLQHIIDSILNIARIEAGKVELTLTLVEIRPYIEEIIIETILLRKHRGMESDINIHKKIENSVPKTVEIDRLKCKQVLLNLLSNALKYTLKGDVTLSVSVDKTHIHFSILDTGIGIKKEDIGTLFNEFQRTSTTVRVEGTGLGLALSMKIISLHGGTINVYSEHRKGSEFIVSIPLKKCGLTGK